MEASFQADMWRKNISRIANAVPGLTCARAQNGCYRRILAWPPPHPTPTPQEFMCHFGVGTYAAGTSASEYFVISPPYFPYICGSIFLKCGSISSTFPCKPEFFIFSLFLIVLCFAVYWNIVWLSVQKIKQKICEICGKVFTPASILSKHIVTTVRINH